ncbi:MAG TPA: efflux RND transporter periplasmic adaptor subunit [Chthonomonadaceae bacterium]|nr:efflux RND transporter periplasmic adaptor subunit [Chthonomonadaceae bacterium]
MFVVIGALAGVMLGGCRKPAAPAAEDASAEPVAVETVKAKTGLVEDTVAAQGVMAAGQGASAHIASSIPGRIVAINVREGDRVHVGELLAVIDNRQQRAQAQSAAAAERAAAAQARSAELAAAAASVEQAGAVRMARLALEAARIDRQAGVEQAQTAVQSAETDLAKTKAGARPQEIAQAEQSESQARATRDRAATELDRVKFLYGRGIDAKRQLDDAQTALTVADSALQIASQQLSLLRAGARSEDLRAAELRVRQARQALAQAEISGNAKVAQAQAGLRQAQQSAEQVAVKRQDARAAQQQAAAKASDLTAARTLADYAEVRSPLPGIVTRRALNPGDMADTTTTILEIGADRPLNLIAGIAPQYAGTVRAGMPARVTSADAPGRIFAASVLSVGQVDPQTSLLTVRLAVANARGALRTGAFATAEIIVRTHPNAVTVPKQAIVSHEGKPVVFVVDQSNVAHQVEVVVGTEQDGNVEITKGVSLGETVIRLGQYELSDGAKVKPAAEASASAETDAPK